MNVSDVEFDPTGIAPIEYPSIITRRQSELEDSYHKIEQRGHKVFPINSRQGQIIAKDFMWRITEEIGEFLEAFYDEANDLKAQEELADGLHFLAGLGVLFNREESFQKAWLDHKPMRYIGGMGATVAVTSFIKALGVLGNTLKMKPWKQTDILTDEIVFTAKYREVVGSYLDLCQAVNLSQMALFELYWKKSEVNLFRIRSKY